MKRLLPFAAFALIIAAGARVKYSRVQDAHLALEINDVARRCALLQAEVCGTTALRDYVVHQAASVEEPAVEEQASEIRVILREHTQWEVLTREAILSDTEDSIRRLRLMEKNRKVLSDRITAIYNGPYGPIIRLLLPADTSASR